MAEDTRSGEAPPVVSGADIRTFLFADMRGYTRYTQEHGDEAASALASRFAELVHAAVPTFDGELLELRGDEALCVFRSARQALRASVELQRRLRTATDGESAFPLGVGMGLDAGEAVPTKGGYRGASLNLAARLCGRAAAGEILASETVKALAGHVDGVAIGPVRSLTVKGVANPVRAVQVRSREPLPPPPSSPRGARRVSGRFALAVGVVIAVVGVGVAVLHGGGSGAPARASGGVRVRVNTVAVVDPVTRRVVADVSVGDQPWAIAAGFGAVWVANHGDGTVTRIDLKTRKPSTIAMGGEADAIAVGDGYVWAFDQFTGDVCQIDPGPPPYQCGTRTRLLDATVVTGGSAREAVGSPWDYTACGSQRAMASPG